EAGRPDRDGEVQGARRGGLPGDGAAQRPDAGDDADLAVPGLDLVVVGLVQAYAEAAAAGARVEQGGDAAVVVLLAAADEGVAGAVQGGAGRGEGEAGGGRGGGPGARRAGRGQPWGCWRRPTKGWPGLSRGGPVAWRGRRPGRSGRDQEPSGRANGEIQCGARAGSSKSSRAGGAGTGCQAPPGAGCRSGTGATTGQPSSSHSTGVRNVSRPSTCTSGVKPRGRTPSSTIHRRPSGAGTRSAWPVFWTGRGLPLWVSRGLPGAPSQGPRGERLRATDTLWPRSVPPSAMSRYHQSPMRYRCGASGNFRPV